MHNIDKGQAIVKHETPTDSSISIHNLETRVEINIRLSKELDDLILSPIVGVQKVRKVLHFYGLDIPALFELEPEGDEIVLEMDQYGKVRDAYDMPQFGGNTEPLYYLYLIYVLNDKGYYDFHTELTDDEGIKEILSEDDEDLDDV
jgi:hypothetical protein